MGALFSKPKQNKIINQTTPEPEKTAEPSEIGDARRAEDQELFGEGGTPQLRVDRAGTPASVGASGSGLKLM